MMIYDKYLRFWPTEMAWDAAGDDGHVMESSHVPKFLFVQNTEKKKPHALTGSSTVRLAVWASLFDIL